MLRWRILVSLVLIPALIGLFYADSLLGERATLLLVLAEVLAIRSVWEMADLFRDRTRKLQVPLVMACAASVVASAWIPRLQAGHTVTFMDSFAFVAITHTLIVLILCLSEAARYLTPGGNVDTLGMEVLIVTYVGLLLAMTVQLRWVAGHEAGYLVLGSLLVCTKGGDIGAYSIGRLFGRNKLAPLLSPGKTWEGVLGALLGAALCGWLWLTFATPAFNSAWLPPPWYASACYGMILGAVGIIGDLVESLMKRDAGKKDSASLFPGFGGLLDLLDSVIYTGPVALVLWLWLPLASWN